MQTVPHVLAEQPQDCRRTTASGLHLWLNLPTVSNVALVPSRYLVRKNTFDTGEAAL